VQKLEEQLRRAAMRETTQGGAAAQEVSDTSIDTSLDESTRETTAMVVSWRAHTALDETFIAVTLGNVVCNASAFGVSSPQLFIAVEFFEHDTQVTRVMEGLQNDAGFSWRLDHRAVIEMLNRFCV